MVGTPYSVNEVVDTLLTLGEARKNYAIAARIYAQRYPDRDHPTPATIRNIEARARKGHLTRHRENVDRMDDGNADPRTVAVLGLVHINPHISLRGIEEELGISKSTAQRILNAAKFHPYHITPVQAFTENDPRIRLEFCNWAEQKKTRDPDFFRRVMFSDEATFHDIGLVNRHNCHYWSAENPHWTRELKTQHRWSLNVWCGILDGHLIGPHFFEESLTGARYLQFLREDLPQLLEDVELQLRMTMWFQQDGAPPHYANQVRAHLNEVFPERWIGRGGPVNWPARSPDLTSLDFFLWGYLKDIVFREPPTSRDDMKERIRRACRGISPNILRKTVGNFEKRVTICRDNNGHHFEQFL